MSIVNNSNLLCIYYISLFALVRTAVWGWSVCLPSLTQQNLKHFLIKVLDISGNSKHFSPIFSQPQILFIWWVKFHAKHILHFSLWPLTQMLKTIIFTMMSLNCRHTQMSTCKPVVTITACDRKQKYLHVLFNCSGLKTSYNWFGHLLLFPGYP